MAKKKNASAAASAAASAVPVETSSVAATAGDATLDNQTAVGNSSSALNTTATTSKKNRKSNNNNANTTDNEEEETEEIELLQVDLGDMVKLKQVLDESVVAALLEHLPEDYAWDNWKLIIMFAACAFAMIAQFAPLPFPEGRPILGLCGSLYFVLSGVLQAIATFVDGDTILWSPIVTSDNVSNKKESGGSTGTTITNKDLEKYGVRVRSSLPRFSEWFTVTLELHDYAKTKSSSTKQPKAKSTQPLPFVSQTWSVGQFFDKDGYFDEIGLGMEVDKLFDRLNASQYDKPPVNVNKPKKD